MKYDFYIGWQEKGPDSYFRTVRVWLLRIIAVTILFIFLWVKFQEELIPSRFDFGNLTQMSGKLVTYPAPMLITQSEGNASESIPLVNFGKFGASGVLNRLENRLETRDLSDYTFTLRGTIIEFDDRRWLELTEEDESILDFSPANSKEQTVPEWRGEVSLKGEIVDPKCFFGVMNPAYGKIHLSCAVRCISGGIPPILVTKGEGRAFNYYFLTSADPENDVNTMVLPYVGLPVNIQGEQGLSNGWKVLQVSGNTALQLTTGNIINEALVASCTSKIAITSGMSNSILTKNKTTDNE